MPNVWIFEFIRASRSKVMVKIGSIECSAEAAQLDASHKQDSKQNVLFCTRGLRQRVGGVARIPEWLINTDWRWA